VGKSLKIYTTVRPTSCYMWGYDIIAMRTLFPGETIEIDTCFELIGETDVTTSLPAKWAALKEEEQAAHGKTTRREFFKFLSNTSYGIKAQRNPYKTIHTNLAIAGLITARAHLILIEMIDVVRRAGCTWIYSDTDSICVEHTYQHIPRLETYINARIAPYGAACEGYNRRTKTLSLKRYTSTGGKNTDGTIPKDKIRLHGRGQYKVTQSDILSWTNGTTPSHRALYITSVAGNTKRTLKRVVKLNPAAGEYQHPFMFETGVKSDRSSYEWFTAWYAHIDTKTTYPEDADVNADFYREIRQFESSYTAALFYGSKIVEGYESEPYGPAIREWDMEDAYSFDISPYD